ncbi:UNVERIFIED_CONTAM: hypothetical protein RMT77_017242 [Armadillidium vulgare]
MKSTTCLFCGKYYGFCDLYKTNKEMWIIYNYKQIENNLRNDNYFIGLQSLTLIGEDIVRLQLLLCLTEIECPDAEFFDFVSDLRDALMQLSLDIKTRRNYSGRKRSG